MQDDEKSILVTTKNANHNLMLAQESLKNLKVVNPNCLNVLDMITHQKVYFTLDSLQEFSQLFLAVSFQSERPKWVRDAQVDELLNVNYKEKDKEPEPVFDPAVGFESNFAFLRDYYDEYQNYIEEEAKKEAKS